MENLFYPQENTFPLKSAPYEKLIKKEGKLLELIYSTQVNASHPLSQALWVASGKWTAEQKIWLGVNQLL